MSDSLRDGIIATVVGGLILSFILRLFPSLGRWLRGLASRISRVFKKSSPWPEQPVATAAPLIKPVPPADVDPQLDEVQWRIMGVFVKDDGGRFTVVDMSYRLPNISKLRIEAAFEGLKEIGLVAKNRNYVDGTSYGLTSEGRDFLIRKDAV